MRLDYTRIIKHDMMKQIAFCIAIILLLCSGLSHAQGTYDPESDFRTATAGIVLLKNHGGLLPLNADEVSSITLIGADAAEMEKIFGNSLYLYTAGGLNKKNDIRTLDSSMVYIGQGVNGFSAKYYNNLKASGTPAKFATDKFIDFNWGHSLPCKEIDTSTFSVMWDATLIPPHGPVKVKLIHNDGCRLYIDGQLIIDAWESGPVRIDSAWLNIEKGNSYNIQIDYFSDGGTALVKFGFEYMQEFLLREAVEKAGRADVALVFVDQPLIYTSDGMVEESYTIPTQSKLIRAVYEANPNTIVVLRTKGAVDIEDWAFDIPCIIWNGMSEAKNLREIAGVLLGEINPEAKLPFRWAMNRNQNFDTRFPLGFGMTYTTIGIGKLLMNRQSDGSGWLATVETSNLGDRAATETLQVFIKATDEFPRSQQQNIKAFKKVTLLPGQKKTVGIPIPYSAFETENIDAGNRIITPGMYQVMVGTSAEDIKLIKTIELKEIHINQYYSHE